MALKRKAVKDVILISDSDNESEPDTKAFEDLQRKLEKRVQSQAKKRVHVGGRCKTSSVSSISASKCQKRGAVKVKAEVHSNRGADADAASGTDDCYIVKATPGEGHKKRLLDIPAVAVEVQVKAESPVQSRSDGSEDIIDMTKTEDDEDSGDVLDESFSQNQEGSRRVQQLLFEQELGE